MIIGLSGYAQAGKDSVAKTLVEKYGFKRVAFADKIRELLYEMNPVLDLDFDTYKFTRLKDLVDAVGWDSAKQHPEVRGLLQRLGVGARTTIYEDFWVNVALADVTNYKDGKNFVITDVRFKNEVAALCHPSLNGKIWRIERSGVGAVNGHVSESELNSLQPDYIIENNTTLEDLESSVINLMEVLRGN